MRKEISSATPNLSGPEHLPVPAATLPWHRSSASPQSCAPALPRAPGGGGAGGFLPHFNYPTFSGFCFFKGCLGLGCAVEGLGSPPCRSVHRPAPAGNRGTSLPSCRAWLSIPGGLRLSVLSCRSCAHHCSYSRVRPLATVIMKT